MTTRDRGPFPGTPAGGAVLLVGAGLSGALLDMSQGWPMTGMLALLGLGWNAGVVGALGDVLMLASLRLGRTVIGPVSAR
jgi:hypothetical protein